MSSQQSKDESPCKVEMLFKQKTWSLRLEHEESSSSDFSSCCVFAHLSQKGETAEWQHQSQNLSRIQIGE